MTDYTAKHTRAAERFGYEVRRMIDAIMHQTNRVTIRSMEESIEWAARQAFHNARLAAPELHND